MSDDFNRAVELMERMGGSFVKSLAHCYRAADSDHKIRLREAFPEIFSRYGAYAMNECEGEKYE